MDSWLVLPQNLTPHVPMLPSILSSRTVEDLWSLWDFLKTSGISFEPSGAAEICPCPSLMGSRVSAQSPPPPPTLQPCERIETDTPPLPPSTCSQFAVKVSGLNPQPPPAPLRL